MMLLCLTVVGFATTTSPASAALIEAYAAGDGGQTASLVVDFGFVGGDAYRFTYRYDDVPGQAPKTGADLLLELDEAGTLDVAFSDFGGDLGLYINGFSYDGQTQTPGFGGGSGETWSYWTSDTAPTLESAWEGRAIGPSGRTLTDGGYDGWTLNISPFNDAANATDNPPSAVPEPAALGMLLLTGAGMLGRRRTA